ncbi:MAG: hypothetical protein JWP21_1586 [Tardiphaga sp.]|nr:hypothetical protein [Tardiphaga sp.]
MAKNSRNLPVQKPALRKIPSPAGRRRVRPLRRVAAWLAAMTRDASAGTALALWFVTAHVVLWTVILVILKGRQDVHFDIAEAYGWGQRFLFGYGKHPPLSGWIAGLWFRVFPVADWAAYALAMAVCGFGMATTWAIALKVVDRRRAFLVLVMVAVYPIFNFKGFKYNADLLQLATLPLLVLAYLHAFEKKTAWSGVALGLAAMLALMTKYWVVTMIGAIGIAALLHPQRMAFLRSPAPWVAIVTGVVAMAPHLVWLWQVDFEPFAYAGGTYTIESRRDALQIILGYLSHNAAMLAVPVGLAALALGWRPRRLPDLIRRPLDWVTRTWAREPNPGLNVSQALNVWVIQAVVAIGPPLGAWAFHIYLKTDWGISLFFLVPLALVALPWLRVQMAAPARLAAIWLVMSLVTLAAAPRIAAYTEMLNAADAEGYGSRSQLARQLTELWRQRFATRWEVVAAETEAGGPIGFYAPDHPLMLQPTDHFGSGLTSLAEAKEKGFIGVCEVGDHRFAACEAWMAANAVMAERLNITTRRIVNGAIAAPSSWRVYIVAPTR